MICTFFGHKNVGSDVKEKIKHTVEGLIKDGVVDYYVGNNGNFDYYVQVVLTEIMKNQSEVHLTVVLSHLGERAMVADQECTLFPEGLELALPRFAISKRNDWLIKNSQIAVIYVNNSFSNSYKLMEKARKKGVKIINI